jgi:glyoxylase-like metal-dependent hydrolase (beta-lactamase superfamily II)
MSNVVQSLPSGLKEVISETSGLQIRIYYLECLAHASYIIFHENKAFVVDPRRDVDAYVEVRIDCSVFFPAVYSFVKFKGYPQILTQELANLGATLAGVLETHFHADFVSGHLELQERFNVPIYFGPGAGSRAKFPLHEVQDGEEISLSTRYCFKVRHTPGHTPESVCYVLLDRDNNSKPIKVFTGDTLFIGSCGRPDLVGSLGHTAEQMAADMYESLTSKLMTLPVDVQVFPAHGAGSPCGKNLGSALYSTIGQEMATNPALQFNEVRLLCVLTPSINRCE